ncbi:hypothetical protein BO85DRAFT_485561 [Aspergillus piperis CBS 112811]|uniref:Cell wall protein n=1 Tax=Aspergillus piperis CBS 112811 TaxID=1448313 RepID=A0A8G1R8Z5_9EURO|nr:hypothetical protein BO85DRAFT_485561 [Aspergillus piperis CBS 112811]RAH60419.1 hypothetical protein BO85DRAFT_485561 [Aspergillus piperis CBS 112811]
MKFTGIAALALAGSVSAAAIPVVDTTVQSTLSQLTGVLGKVDNVVGGLVGCATTDLTDLKDELSTIEGKLTQLLPSNKRDLTGTVGGVATPVVGIAGDAAGTVKGVASGAVNTVGNVAGGAVNTVEGVASPVVKTVGGAVDSVASPVVNAAGGAVGTVKGAASGVVSSAVNLKRDITDLSGLSETLVAKIQSGDLTAGALEKVLDLLSQNGGLANLQSVLSLV